MNAKLYEILLSLMLLQHGRLREEDLAWIDTFLRETQGGGFDPKLLAAAAGTLGAGGLDPDSRALRCKGFIGYMDWAELRVLSLFWDAFLGRHPRPRWEALRLVLYGAQCMKASAAIHITQRSSPHLFAVLGHQEDYEELLSRMQVLRGQMADIIRTEGGMPMPLWEVLVQLTVLHCAWHHVADLPGDLHSILSRFARRSLPGLSFQQVMRLCDSLDGLTARPAGVQLLFIEQVDLHLDFDAKRAMLAALLDLKARAADAGEGFLHYVACVVAAAKFSADDLGHLRFSLTSDHRDLPPHFTVLDLSLERETRLGLAGRALLPAEEAGAGAIPVVLSQVDPKHIRMEVAAAGRTETREYEENAVQSLGELCLVFRPSLGRVCAYPYSTSILSVDKVGLLFRGNRILTDVTFTTKTGEMVAVIGPSGCGKSTLLTILSGILPRTDGHIYFNRRRLETPEDFSAVCTYIPQDDILFRELTVRESIDSSLRLKVACPAEERKRRVRETVDVLGLERAESLKIGLEGEKGISGGQRKRVNMGTTIVAEMKPILLFDEPTSGLDPATDIEIMQLLRTLSRRGHIVMCVTHNLSDESIHFFDKIMVLGKSGQVVFFGKRQRLLYFFAINGPQVLFQKMRDTAHVDWRTKYATTPECTGLDKRVQNERKLIETRLEPAGPARRAETTRLPGPLSNLATFLERELRRKMRDRQFLAMCLLQPAFIAAFLAWYFDGPLPNAVFALITAVLWIGAISGVREINSEWPQLKRDHLYGTSLLGYFLSKTASVFGFAALQVLILSVVVVLAGGYLGAPFGFSLAGLLAVLLLLALFGVVLGLFLSAAVKSTLAAVGILPVVLIPLVIMGGALSPHCAALPSKSLAMAANPLRIAFEGAMYQADQLLRPKLALEKRRTVQAATEQRAKWKDYLGRKTLYEKDQPAYRAQFAQADVNAMFDDILSGKPAGEDAVPPPSRPLDVQAPELLLTRPGLWLDGYSLLPVDRPKDGTGNAYPVRAPRAFSEDVSVQGAMGLYREAPGGPRSFYPPAGYFLALLGEILGIGLLTWLVLRLKLERKFS